jgi:maltose O-acetyltransferase
MMIAIMLKNIKNAIGKIVYSYKNSSNDYLQFLKKKGVSVGDNVRIFAPRITNIESINPHLLTIGSHVAITGPATILTHDYSVCVTKVYKHGEIMGNQKPVIIEDNVFVGWGACILPGTHVKKNTIIGAYAVVSGALEENSVYAGNPAKRICSIDEYYEKRKSKQVEEAVNIYRHYTYRFNKKPTEDIFHDYFFLFGWTVEKLHNSLRNKFKDNGNEEESIKAYIDNKPIFDSFDSFCRYAEEQIEKQ